MSKVIKLINYVIKNKKYINSNYNREILKKVKNDTIITNSPLNIIVCNKNDNISKFNNYELYKVNDIKKIKHLFNPAFFKLIIITNTIKEDLNTIQMVYNYILINGTFIIPKKYYNLFKELNNPYKEYGDYIIIHKKNNKILNNKNRFIEAIIGGTQKGSTTSALINLKKHKDISADSNEVHYYDLYWYKGEEQIKKLHNYNKKIVLIKSPELMYLSNTHWMIQDSTPFVKFIIFLRNPITRAYSSWQMLKNLKWTDKTFEESIYEELKYRLNENKIFKTAQWHFLQRGLYYDQIINLLKWFPMQNIKIMIIENFKNDMIDEYNEIYDFLNLEHINDINYTKERINTYENDIDKDIYDKLVDFYREDVKYLEELLGYKTNWFTKN
jgi:hypothetical protein